MRLDDALLLANDLDQSPQLCIGNQVLAITLVFEFFFVYVLVYRLKQLDSVLEDWEERVAIETGEKGINVEFHAV